MNTVFIITMTIAFALFVYCVVEFIRSYLTIKRCDTDLKILRRRKRNIIMSFTPDPEEEAYK
jgi:hypothetical protein